MEQSALRAECGYTMIQHPASCVTTPVDIPKNSPSGMVRGESPRLVLIPHETPEGSLM